jgi:hypothetical protein
MGGGERGARGRLTKVRVGSRRWQGALKAAKDMVSFFLPYPRQSTGLSATAWPRRCWSV